MSRKQLNLLCFIIYVLSSFPASATTLNIQKLGQLVSEYDAFKERAGSIGEMLPTAQEISEELARQTGEKLEEAFRKSLPPNHKSLMGHAQYIESSVYRLEQSVKKLLTEKEHDLEIIFGEASLEEMSLEEMLTAEGHGKLREKYWFAQIAIERNVEDLRRYKFAANEAGLATSSLIRFSNEMHRIYNKQRVFSKLLAHDVIKDNTTFGRGMEVFFSYTVETPELLSELEDDIKDLEALIEKELESLREEYYLIDNLRDNLCSSWQECNPLAYKKEMEKFDKEMERIRKKRENKAIMEDMYSFGDESAAIEKGITEAVSTSEQRYREKASSLNQKMYGTFESAFEKIRKDQIEKNQREVERGNSKSTLSQFETRRRAFDWNPPRCPSHVDPNDLLAWRAWNVCKNHQQQYNKWWNDEVTPYVAGWTNRLPPQPPSPQPLKALLPRGDVGAN